MRTRWHSLRARTPAWLWDGGLVLLALLLLVIELRSFEAFGYLDTDAVAVLLYAVLFGVLLARRRLPLTVAALVLTTSYVYQALGYAPLATVELASLVALFSAAAYGRALPRVLPLGAIALWHLAVSAVSPAPLEVGGVVILYVILAGAWMLGERERSHRAYSAMLEERNALLERQRELEAEQVAATERTRIARELHDVIAHGLGVVVVQAEAALYASDDTAPATHGPLEAIRSTARASLAEARRILGMLRGQDTAVRTPQPGIADLARLADEFASAGLEVSMSIQGNPPPVEPGVDLSIYRLIEEALTNTLRHANARTATVTLDFQSEAVHLEVLDDGVPRTGHALPPIHPEPARSAAHPEPVEGGALASTGAAHVLTTRRRAERTAPQRQPPPPTPSTNGNGHTGHGHIGMRERVAMLHGALEVGPMPEGGYAVRATLPLAARPLELVAPEAAS